MVYMLESK